MPKIIVENDPKNDDNSEDEKPVENKLVVELSPEDGVRVPKMRKKNFSLNTSGKEPEEHMELGGTSSEDSVRDTG